MICHKVHWKVTILRTVQRKSPLRGLADLEGRSPLGSRMRLGIRVNWRRVSLEMRYPQRESHWQMTRVMAMGNDNPRRGWWGINLFRYQGCQCWETLLMKFCIDWCWV